MSDEDAVPALTAPARDACALLDLILDLDEEERLHYLGHLAYQLASAGPEPYAAAVNAIQTTRIAVAEIRVSTAALVAERQAAREREAPQCRP